MKKIIVLSSVTYALKAQEILKSNGIYSNITRSKAVRSVRGCGYGISFDPSVSEKVNSLLADAGVMIVGSTEEK
ncbi:MAG: DUF3343 domain-containing protein [Clostridia bacterium]|nr:DUF3343 domain-containing protein [Clostridia bacterium]MBR6784593.1 DUF3343 domain-containing protein [Clostridia bacterium]